MAFTIEIDKKRLKEVEAALSGIRNGAQTAFIRAINQGVKGGKTDSSKLIRSQVTLKKADVDKNISTDLASKSKVSGALRFKSAKVALSKYKYSETRKGVKVKVWKSGSTQFLPHAFTAKVCGKTKLGEEPKCHVGIFHRYGDKVGTGVPPHPPTWFFAKLAYKYKKMTELLGPTIEYLFERSRDKLLPYVQVNASQRYFDEFERQVGLLIDKAKK
jgi:hypothetical protein